MDDEAPKVGIAELAEKAKLTLLRAATCIDDEDFEDAALRLAVAVAQVEHIRFLVGRTRMAEWTGRRWADRGRQ